MTGMGTMQTIKSIPNFGRINFIERTRSFNDILQISWPFLSRIIYGIKRPEPIPRGGSREGVENSRGIDDKTILILLRLVIMIRAILMNENLSMMMTSRLGVQQMSICLVF